MDIINTDANKAWLMSSDFPDRSFTYDLFITQHCRRNCTKKTDLLSKENGLDIEIRNNIFPFSYVEKLNKPGAITNNVESRTTSFDSL